MTDIDRNRLRSIKSFSQLVKYLKEDLEWPIETEDFEELTYHYDPEELGIDPKNAVNIEEIQQLRPLVTNQPWGIFFVKFGKNRLSVVALRRILSQLVIKKRASMRKADQPSWHLHDLLFISNFCEDNERKITFAQFTQNEETNDLPTLKVLGWDEGDTALHMDHVQRELKDKLRWPKNENDAAAWRDQWSSAFTLRHREVITTSKDLAVRLADLAKKIRNRALQVLAIESEKGRLRKLHKAFREALVHDLSEKDFADMYAQTIAYGLLAARVSRPMGITADNIVDMVPNTNPFLKEMLGVFLKVGGRKGGIDFDELGVQDVVDLLKVTNMEAVLRDFGNRTQREDPVIHFYELFLKEYDRQKKVERGVFYTPQPVVSYIVRSVHELLQTEFGLEDGLASTITWGEMIKKNPDLKLPILKPKIPDDKKSEDITISPDEPFVTILDPATGTATFLVESIDIIHKTMTAKWEKEGLKPQQVSQKWNEYIPQHLLPRLYGFELMMAPYAIAHMKIGLKLNETGYNFKTDERVRVYLTNSLEPASDSVQRDLTYYSEALAHEATAVNEVKRNKRFTSVIGNPPYSANSINTGEWITDLIRRTYYPNDEIREQNPKLLLDDYVKFIIYSQSLISQSKIGILSFITNHGYLDNPTFRRMRQQLNNSFNCLYTTDLHGNVSKKEQSPDGTKDENVFDIQQGVAILIALQNAVINKNSSKENFRSIVYRSDLWGSRERKYSELNQTNVKNSKWTIINLIPPFLLFKSQNTDLLSEYRKGLNLIDVFPINSTGVKTHRDHFVIDFDLKPLERRIAEYRDLEIKDQEIRSRYNLLDTSEWKLHENRKLFHESTNWKKMFTKIMYRSMDFRWIYYNPLLLERSRWDVMHHLLSEKNLGLIFMRQVAMGDIYSHFYVSRYPVDNRAFYSNKGTIGFAPLYITDKQKIEPNFSSKFIKQFCLKFNFNWLNIGKGNFKNDIGPEDLFDYFYAIFYSPTYRTRYSEFLKMDFPRVPLPGSLALFKELTSIGGELITFHLMESPKLDKWITKYAGTTPSCDVEKVIYSDNTVWIDKAQTIGFSGVPENVWNFHIGGYQVCDKWLKDRKGRQLSAEDIAHYQKVVVALNETIRIMGEIDAVIENHKGWPKAFDMSERCEAIPEKAIQTGLFEYHSKNDDVIQL